MRKNLFGVAVLSALALPLLFSCNKQNGNESGDVNNGTEIVFKDPSTKDAAMEIRFDKGTLLALELPDRKISSDPSSAVSGDPVSVKFSSLILSEANRYVAKISKKADKECAIVWTGRYSYNAGDDTYELEGLGKVKVQEGKTLVYPVAVKATYSQDPVTITCTIVKINGGNGNQTLENMARNWTVLSTYVKINGGKNSVSIGKGFMGCDLHEMASYCKEKGVSLTDEDVNELEGYSVKEINLVANGTVVVSFTGRDSYSGTWDANSKTFTWTLENSNQILSADATGEITFLSDSECKLVLDAKVVSGSETYTGTITFDLKEVN